MSGRRAAPTRVSPTGCSRMRTTAPAFCFAKVPGGKVGVRDKEVREGPHHVGVEELAHLLPAKVLHGSSKRRAASVHSNENRFRADLRSR